MRRKAILLVTAMAAALVLCSTAAFAALREGTDGGETLTGTRKADEIIGLGGNDLLRGLAGSDVYRFGDGFGEDTLEEKYGKRGGRSDLVDFSEVDDSIMKIGLIPEYDNLTSNGCLNEGPDDCSQARAFAVSDDSATGKVDFAKTAPEKATGSANTDIIMGGKEKNVISGGPGRDFLFDFGGVPAENIAGLPALAASNDTFVAGEGVGDDVVTDLAGSADTLDLRAMGDFGEVGIETLPRTSGTGTDLVFTKPDKSVSVLVQGGVTPSFEVQKNGVMETVIFADGAKSAAEVLAKAEGPAEAQEASSSASSSSADQQQQLAERAKKLLEDAQATLPLFGKNGAAGE